MTRRIQGRCAFLVMAAVMVLGTATSTFAQAVCTTLSARAKTGSIELTWPAIPGATSITVQRGAAVNGPFAPLATIPGTATVYTDTPVANNVLFYYRLDATTGSGACGSQVIGAMAPAARTAVVVAPNVVGDTEPVARGKIVAARLAVGAVTQAASAVVPAGQIISQDPPAGSSVPTGSAVAFVVSSGAGDTTAPTVTINQAAGQADPTNAAPILFTVVFSEPVTGFATGDVTLGGTAGATTAVVSGSGATYTVSVSGMAGTGTVSASIAAGVAQDAASLPNAGSTSTDNTVTFDNDRPTVTLNQAAGQANPTNASPILFTVVFSEPVIGFSTGDVTLGGTAGATTAVVSGSGATYTVSVSGMAGAGTVSASIAAGVATDAAGNTNFGSVSADNTVTFQTDTTAPTVTINQAAGQADPTNAAPILFTVVFSEPVIGFSTGDVTLGGTAGATTAVVSGSGATYTVSVSGMAGAGAVSASIAAGVATDAAGNTNLGSVSTDNTVTFDNAAPTVTINRQATQSDPTNASPILFDVVFSEPVTGFATGDVTLGGTAGATSAVVTGSGANYVVSVSGMTTNGTVIVSIAAGRATDAGGNGNAASTSSDNSVDYDAVRPSVTINQAAGQSDPANASPILFTVVFSEPVFGFALADVTIGGTSAGATATQITGGPSTYTLSVSATAAGTVVASLAAGVAQDAAGNTNLVSTSTDNTVTFSTGGVVPNVLNLTEAAATTAITNAGLVVGTVTQANDPTVPIGQVASQAPIGGTSVALGSAVDLVISLGSGAGVPATLSLAISQALVGGGGTIDITPEVRTAADVIILPTPAITYSILVGVGATGTVPGINGAQVTTSPDTRGNYTLRGTVTGTAVTADVGFTVVDGDSTSSNVGKLVKLSASENRAANALDDLLEALQDGNLGAVAGINGALQAAKNLSPLTGPNTVRRSAAVAPETGFLPTPSRLQSNGFPTTAADTAFGALIPQIVTKLGQLTSFYNTLDPASGTDSVAQLNTLNNELLAVRNQLFSLAITPRGIVNNSRQINNMMANNFSDHLHALAGKVNTVLADQGLLAGNIRPEEFFGQKPGGELAMAAPGAFYAKANPAFFGLLGLIGGSSLQMKLVNEIYGEIMQEVTRMMVILIADGLIDSYTNFARLEGITTGGSLSFHAFGLPGSTVQGSGMDTTFLGRNEVFLVGPAQVSAVQNAATACNPTNWSNLQDAYNCFDAIVNGLGDSYELAHQPPSSIQFGCLLDIFDEHSGCTTLEYNSGFDDVNDTRFPSPVIVLYHNLDTGSRSFGTFNFVP